MIHICIKQHLATFEAQLTKMLSSTEDELNKSVAYKRTSNFIKTLHVKEIFLQNDFLHHNMWGTLLVFQLIILAFLALKN